MSAEKKSILHAWDYLTQKFRDDSRVNYTLAGTAGLIEGVFDILPFVWVLREAGLCLPWEEAGDVV